MTQILALPRVPRIGIVTRPSASEVMKDYEDVVARIDDILEG
jgi:hypothetical protein